MADGEWEDKAYLKYLPPHLQDRYREGLSDPELTHLSRQMALVDVRIKSLLETLDQQPLTIEQLADDLMLEFKSMSQKDALKIGDFILGYLPNGFINYRTFKRLATFIDKYEIANLEGRDREAKKQLARLFHEIKEGKTEGDVWEDIDTAMDQRRKLAEAENRRSKDAEQSLPLDRVVLLAGILIESFRNSVMRYVADREIQQYILEEADRNYQRQLGMEPHRAKDERLVDGHVIG